MAVLTTTKTSSAGALLTWPLTRPTEMLQYRTSLWPRVSLAQDGAARNQDLAPGSPLWHPEAPYVPRATTEMKQITYSSWGLGGGAAWRTEGLGSAQHFTCQGEEMP